MYNLQLVICTAIIIITCKIVYLFSRYLKLSEWFVEKGTIKHVWAKE